MAKPFKTYIWNGILEILAPQASHQQYFTTTYWLQICKGDTTIEVFSVDFNRKPRQFICFALEKKINIV